MARPEPERVRTGVAGLDAILGGGIPRGNVILLEGAIGTGKTTLGVEFAYHGAKEFGEPGVIVVFEVSPDKLARDAAGLGFDLPDLERRDKLKIIYTTREVFRQELQQADSLLLEEAAKIGARRIFIDGAAGVLPLGEGGDSRDTFHILVQGLQRERLTAVLALEAAALNGADFATLHEESIADTVIRLRLEDTQRAATRSIEIVKSRGHAYQMGRHSFRIVDGKGIEVYRRVQAPRPPSRDQAGAFDPSTRVSTGIPGLDPVVNGGYFLGSTTVGGRDLGGRQERHGAALPGRGRAARRAQPAPVARRAGAPGAAQRDEHRDRPAAGDRPRRRSPVLRSAAGNRDRPPFPQNRADRRGIQAQARGDRHCPPTAPAWARRGACSATSFTRWSR